MALFRGPRDRQFIKKINKEVIKHIIDQKILYFPVSLKLSEVDDLYGESKNKVVDPPVEIPTILEWKDQEVSTSQFGQDVIYHVDAYVLDEHLDEVLVQPKEGDYFEFGDIRFEITEITIPSLIFAKENDELGRKLTARSVRRETFEISVSASVAEPERTAPDEKGDLDSFQNDIIFAHSSSNAKR